MSTIISSQRYLDEATVAAKVAASDFAVSRTAAFRARGKTITVTLPPDAYAALQAWRQRRGMSQRVALTRLLLDVLPRATRLVSALEAPADCAGAPE